MRRNIAIIYGGFSGERVISEKSAQVVRKYIEGEKFAAYLVDIDRDGWWFKDEAGGRVAINKNEFSLSLNQQTIKFDGVFCAIHGTPGEDGVIQGYFDIIGIPYNNCGVLASAITFNKAACNRYLKASGVNVAISYIARLGHSFNEVEIIEKVGLPCFVKPNDGGSSIGVTKVKHVEQLTEAIKNAQAEGVDALIESLLVGTEVSCGCVSKGGVPKSTGVTEIVPANEFFDFDSKYLNQETQEITPARIDPSVYAEVTSLTENIYGWLHCKGMIRVDYMICETGIYLIEVNTTPGLSEASIIPQQAKHSGYTLEEFFELSLTEMFRD
jgi:D-alanine-D-alanine ligase